MALVTVQVALALSWPVRGSLGQVYHPEQLWPVS